MAKPAKTGVARIIAAYGYALKGYKVAFQYEEAFRQELLLFCIMLPLALLFAPGFTEMALLVGSLFLVLIVELINSAIEAVVDRIGDEHHELAGRAKDIAAAAVLTALLGGGAIWLIIFVPVLYQYFI